MSEELIIEQPQSGVWLSPGKRVGHLIAIFNCTEKKFEYDKMSGKEKEKATFDFVDLDQECQLVTGYDNHPGVTFKLRAGNPAVVLGRIRTEPSQYAQDAVVLGEHTEADAMRLRNWHKAQASGFGPSLLQRPVAQRQPPAQAPAASQVAPQTPQPAAAAPQSAPAAPSPAAATSAQDLLSSLDAGTLALLMKAAAQNGGQ